MRTITNRDLKLFGELGKYGILTTSQIASRIFPGVQGSTILRRLRALEEAKWIYRIKAMESGELVWLLSRKGEEEAGLDTSMVKPNRNGVEHDVWLTNLRHQLEAVGLGQNFVPEWVIRRQTYRPTGRSSVDAKLIPDGIFSATTWKKEVHTFAVELELHGKNASRYEKIFKAYQDQGHLDFVWYFVKSKSFGEALFPMWQAARKRLYRAPRCSLIFTVLSDFEKNGRKALVHFEPDNAHPIERVFQIPEITKPAQAPAQPVGTPSEVIQDAPKIETAK